MIRRERCDLIIRDEEIYDYLGKVLCEDCYMYETNPPKACDPLVVAFAMSVRKIVGAIRNQWIDRIAETNFSCYRAKRKNYQRRVIEYC
jgi:hypothetical protein